MRQKIGSKLAKGVPIEVLEMKGENIPRGLREVEVCTYNLEFSNIKESKSSRYFKEELEGIIGKGMNFNNHTF
jgi:hypothetical protein